MDVANEQWRPCPGFSKYEVSNLGNFRNAKTLKLLKKHVNSRSGRMFIVPYLGNKKCSAKTAPLIAAAWIGPRPEGTQVDHVDGVKEHEWVGNLEYTTQETNIQRSYDKGQHPEAPKERFFLSAEDYEKVKALWATGKYSQVTIGHMLGIDNSTVSKIVNGKTNPHPQRQPRQCPTARRDRLESQLVKAREHLSKGPMSSYQLAKAMGVSAATALRYKWELGRRSGEGEDHAT